MATGKQLGNWLGGCPWRKVTKETFAYYIPGCVLFGMLWLVVEPAFTPFWLTVGAVFYTVLFAAIVGYRLYVILPSQRLFRAAKIAVESGFVRPVWRLGTAISGNLAVIDWKTGRMFLNGARYTFSDIKDMKLAMADGYRLVDIVFNDGVRERLRFPIDFDRTAQCRSRLRAAVRAWRMPEHGVAA